MSHKRQGKAKVLSSKEINSLLQVSLPSARDQAFFMFCLYTGCRVSEARKMCLSNVFHEGAILQEIVIPKEITKGKQGTRIIPTHPSLAQFLEKYYQESLELVKLRNTIGNWSHLNMNEQKEIRINQKWKCPHCESTHVFKSGTYKSEQRYCCKQCLRTFRESFALRNETVLEPVISSLSSLGVMTSDLYGQLFRDPNNPFLFPGKSGKGCLSLRAALAIFETAFATAGIVGASSHSCRRTALTIMHAAGVPLRVLQEISGHKDLGALQKYLEVTEEQVIAAIHVLG